MEGGGGSGVEGSEVAVAGEALRFMRRVKRPKMRDDCQNNYLAIVPRCGTIAKIIIWGGTSRGRVGSLQLGAASEG